MSKRNSLTHVRTFLEYVVRTATYMIDHNNEHPNSGGLRLPPAYEYDLREIKLLGAAILRKHAAKNTRKDVYVERPPKEGK